MKNMFKMMGVALLAGAMLFTACKKDEETTTTTTTATPAITISYMGNSWTADTVYAQIANGEINGSIYIGTDNEPLFTFKCGAAPEIYTFTGTNWYARYYEKASDANYTAISSQNGTIKINSIENNTINAVVSAEMGEMGSGNMLSININNAVLSQGSK